MSNLDQTKVPTTQPDMGTKGDTCFNPYDTDGKLDTKLGGMVKSCSGGGNLGCYSLAYAIKREFFLNHLLLLKTVQANTRALKTHLTILSTIILNVAARMTCQNIFR